MEFTNMELVTVILTAVAGFIPSLVVIVPFIRQLLQTKRLTKVVSALEAKEDNASIVFKTLVNSVVELTKEVKALKEKEFNIEPIKELTNELKELLISLPNRVDVNLSGVQVLIEKLEAVIKHVSIPNE